MKLTPLSKIVDRLDDAMFKIDEWSISYVGTDSEKRMLLSNTSFELHKLIEELDEFNLNNQ